MMTSDQKNFYRMTCLHDERAEALTKRILSNPRDVSYEWYSKLFKDFDWEAYERAKTTSCQ